MIDERYAHSSKAQRHPDEAGCKHGYGPFIARAARAKVLGQTVSISTYLLQAIAISTTNVN